MYTQHNYYVMFLCLQMWLSRQTVISPFLQQQCYKHKCAHAHNMHANTWLPLLHMLPVMTSADSGTLNPHCALTVVNVQHQMVNKFSTGMQIHLIYSNLHQYKYFYDQCAYTVTRQDILFGQISVFQPEFHTKLWNKQIKILTYHKQFQISLVGIFVWQLAILE